MSPNRWLRQWCRSRAVSGVTCQEFGSGSSRQRSTCWRMPLISPVRSYCCVSVSSACAASWKTISRCPPRRFFTVGIAEMKATFAPLGFDLVRRLAAPVELPVAGRVLVRRVQNRLLEETGVHLAYGKPTQRRQTVSTVAAPVVVRVGTGSATDSATNSRSPPTPLGFCDPRVAPAEF